MSIHSNYPPNLTSDNQNLTPQTAKRRDSNLELFRIIVMLLIVAHHYVVNSGLYQLIREAPATVGSTAMLLFGAWGKTGINCFVLITGYFMCKSSFTWQKLIKLYAQILFYTLIIYAIFCITGHETLSAFTAMWKIFPIKGLSDGFTSCFLMFFLFIPFINIFLKNISKKQHAYLVILLLTMYSILPMIPKINFTFNYVSWFIAIYILASYLRFYGEGFKITHKQWGWLSLISVVLGSLSIVGLSMLKRYNLATSFNPYFFIADSNKFLAVAIAITTFMWFKGLKINYSPIINTIGATTFGVFLIHANSNAMRQWLWKDTIDCVGHFGPSVLMSLGYAATSVLIVFAVCSFVDWIRGRYLEKFLLKFLNSIIRKSQMLFAKR